MTDNEVIGMAVMGVITLGSVFTIFLKATKPINDLNLNIIKLTETIKNLLENEKVQNKRLDKHGEEIDRLRLIVNKHEEKFKNLEDK